MRSLLLVFGAALALVIVTVASVALIVPTDPVLTPAPSTDPQTSFEQLFATPAPGKVVLPVSKLLPSNYHVFQSFNNCGPAALSMTLYHYGISVSQQELGQALRPYQVRGGDNDDKSVTLAELAVKSKEYGFTPYHRPNGTAELVKQFLALDMPVITRTWLKVDDDIGHYRVIKGYDDTTGEFIQDDSLQGKNLHYTYEEFDALWKKFSYEYLVLVPVGKEQAVETILGENADEKTAWANAVEYATDLLEIDPNDVTTRFNLSVALYHTGDYAGSVREFERIENQLSFRTLWYQIEPIQSYFELGNDARVFQITDQILNNHNRAFSELYILRGQIYQRNGQPDLARSEYEKAVQYNQNLTQAHTLLESL